MKKILVFFTVVGLTAFVFNGIAFNATQAADQVQKVEAKVNVNTASVKDLATLPGIGIKTANNVVNFRENHGPFKNAQDLLKVKGVGKKTLKKIENLISFEQ